MTNIDYYPIDPDAISAAVSAEDRQRVEDLCDSIAWYKRQRERSGGWTRAIEQCEEELEELTGSSDVAELEAVLEASDDRDGETSDEAELARKRAQWYEDHGWSKAAETAWDEYAELSGSEDG